MSDDKEWPHAERFANTECDTEEFYDALAAKTAAYRSQNPELRKEQDARSYAKGAHAKQLRVSRRHPDTPRGWAAETQRRRDRLNAEGKALDHIVPFMHAKEAGLECDENLQELPKRRDNHRKGRYEPISDEEAVAHVRAGRACPWDLIDQNGDITDTKQQPLWAALSVLLKLMAEEPDMTFQQMTDIARDLRRQAETARDS